MLFEFLRLDYENNWMSKLMKGKFEGIQYLISAKYKNKIYLIENKNNYNIIKIFKHSDLWWVSYQMHNLWS